MRLLLLLVACDNSSHLLQQHEVTAAGELLAPGGTLREAGWSRRMLQTWDASKVNDASKLRQWDFFTVQSDSAAVNLTLTDLGFIQLASVGVVDYAKSAKHDASLFKGGGDVLALSGALEGDASLTAGGVTAMHFHTSGDTTQIDFSIPMSLLGEAAQGSFTIHRRPTLEYLSLATPFAGDPHQFFFEQKLEGMTADGTVTVGGSSWTFSSASAVMDWGRGQWPQSATWRWAGASGVSGGKTLSFNLGEGFGDDTHGTENLIVYDDVAHKLGRVSWTHGDDPLADWSFHGDGVSLVLHPVAKETGGLDFGAKYSHLKKGYGTFSGTLTVDGLTLAVDNLDGFAEEEELAW
jgi:hypothetical protein